MAFVGKYEGDGDYAYREFDTVPEDIILKDNLYQLQPIAIGDEVEIKVIRNNKDINIHKAEAVFDDQYIFPFQKTDDNTWIFKKKLSQSGKRKISAYVYYDFMGKKFKTDMYWGRYPIPVYRTKSALIVNHPFDKAIKGYEGVTVSFDNTDYREGESMVISVDTAGKIKNPSIYIENSDTYPMVDASLARSTAIMSGRYYRAQIDNLPPGSLYINLIGADPSTGKDVVYASSVIDVAGGEVAGIPDDVFKKNRFTSPGSTSSNNYLMIGAALIAGLLLIRR